MIYGILLVFIFLFAFYYSFTRVFISPLSLLLLAFIMSLTIIVWNTDNWQVAINNRFPIYVFLSVASFAFGCLISNILSGKLVFVSGKSAVFFPDCNSKLWHETFLLIILPFLCTLIFVFLSMRIGSGGAAGNVFRNIYEASAENSSSFILHQMREIVVAAAEVTVIAVFAKKYVYKTRIRLGYLIPIFCYSLCTLFSTDRNIFLRFIIFSVCIWIFFVSAASTRSVQYTNGQVLRKTVAVLVIAVGLFYLLGKVKSYTSNLERMIGIYGGSGLYNFNLCLDKLEWVKLQHGKETFSQFLLTLKRFGLDLGEPASNVAGLGMVVFLAPNGYVYASNIYSAMAPYVTDFGMLGVVIYPFALGLFFEKLYISAGRMVSFYAMGIYSLLVYAVVYYPISEQFFMRFHLGLVYELGWFSIFYFLTFGSKRLHIVGL